MESVYECGHRCVGVPIIIKPIITIVIHVLMRCRRAIGVIGMMMLVPILMIRIKIEILVLNFIIMTIIITNNNNTNDDNKIYKKNIPNII